MRFKFKKTLAVLASAAMCSSMALNLPADTFDISWGTSAYATTEVTYWSDYASDREFASGLSNSYEIATADDLAAFAKAVNNTSGYWYGTVTLTADIDLGAHYWIPIGDDDSYLIGTFDGRGHTIKGMTVDTEGLYNVGLFGSNHGTIKNVHLGASCSVTGTEVEGYIFLVGSICGNNSGTVENCSNAGTVTNSYDTVGGICGENWGTIKKCYNAGAVKGTKNVGGICGHNRGGFVKNCYNTGDIEGTSNVGGVCGYNSYYAIANCYNTGTVTGDSNTGKIVGNNWNEIGNSYYLADSDDGKGGKTEEQFSSGEVAYLLSQDCELTYSTLDQPATATFEGEGWGQLLSGDDKDAFPVFSDDNVYCVYKNCDGSVKKYSNTEVADVVPQHDYTDENEAYSVTDFNATEHTLECTVCESPTTESHSYTDGECTVCGFLEAGSGADFIVTTDLTFKCDESSGSLTENGYAWNHETRELTLANVYIDGNVTLPYYGTDGYEEPYTVIISGSSTAVITGYITGTPYATSLTIKGDSSENKGTIYCGIDNANVGETDTLTIQNVKLVSSWFQWPTNGGVSVENSELVLSGDVCLETIEIDDTSKIKLSTRISGYGNVEDGMLDIMHHLPEGYTLVKAGESYYVADSDGNEVETAVTFDGSVVTECADENEDGMCDSCGKYSDGIGGLAGYSLTLEGNIGVNFFMELDDSVLTDEKAYMQFTLGGEEYSTMKVSEAAEKMNDDGETYYVFKCEVPAKDIETEITAQIILGDDTEGTVYKYTVKNYADEILGNKDDYSEETIDLVNAMVSYCSYAKAYFSNTELAATTEMEAVTADTLADYEYTVSGGTDTFDVEYIGSSLLLKSETTLRHYFNGEVEGATKKDDDLWYIDITDITADKLGTAQDTIYNGITISYSPLSYAYEVLKSETTSDSLKNLVKAMYLYYEAAYAYANPVRTVTFDFYFDDNFDNGEYSYSVTANGDTISDGDEIQIENGGSFELYAYHQEASVGYDYTLNDNRYYSTGSSNELNHTIQDICEDFTITIMFVADTTPQ